jgi:hypothetical protein
VNGDPLRGTLPSDGSSPSSSACVRSRLPSVHRDDDDTAYVVAERCLADQVFMSGSVILPNLRSTRRGVVAEGLGLVRRNEWKGLCAGPESNARSVTIHDVAAPCARPVPASHTYHIRSDEPIEITQYEHRL